MSRIFVFFLIVTAASFCDTVQAQTSKNDSLFVEIANGRAMAVHKVLADENLYSIAQKYSVPALVLSQNNDISFYEKLVPGRTLMIPLGNYNYVQPGDLHAHTVFYRLHPGDDYVSVADKLDIKEQSLRDWNHNTDIAKLKAVNAGWITYTEQGRKSNVIVSSDPAPRPAAETPKAITVNDTLKEKPSDLELVYNYQTSDGILCDSLSGMIVFFKPQTTVNSKLLYAFSNDIGRGRVIKVVNPSNKKFVFAKIIGPLPATKQYINAKIGLDGRARAELETREVKLWCDFYFKY